MRYASIRSLDISNGEGAGMSLFVQGCGFHCPECFNSETWDFNGGKEWDEETEDEFIRLARRPYITRISILGGEPLAHENLSCVSGLLSRLRSMFPEKKIWLYSGYAWEETWDESVSRHPATGEDLGPGRTMRKEAITNCTIYVDGRYERSLKDPTLRFRGSSNQRLIDVQKSLKKGEVIEYIL